MNNARLDPRAIIFDLDGTLLDTLLDIANAMNRALARLGFAPHDLDRYRHFVGDGVDILVWRSLPEARRNKGLLARGREAMQEEYVKNWDATTRLYDGMAALLDELTRRRIPLAILSNKPHDLTDLLSRRFLSAWPFHPVLGAAAHRPRKPDPRAALEISRTLQVSPDRILLVGDTDTDLETARAAGMIPAGVLWGFRPEQIAASDVRHRFRVPADLLAAL